MSGGLDQISEFKITQISGPGSIYMDERPIQGTDFSRARTVDISNMKYENPVYLKADPQTSFEFYCFGAIFTVTHDSYIYYLPDSRELRFLSGQFYWKRSAKGESIDVHLPGEAGSRSEAKERSLTLSERGRLKASSDSLEIWNYSGTLGFTNNARDYSLKAGQMLSLYGTDRVNIADILPAPAFIAPESKVITLKKPADAVVHFSWKAVIGAKDYKLQLFSSAQRENLLDEWVLNTGSKSVNLHRYNDFKKFYWQVFALDQDEKEGIPSQLGLIKLIGALSGQNDTLTPPRLELSSLTVSGNMVVIKGEAQTDSQLYINGRPVSINMDGSFFETLKFRTIGTKTISFRLVAPTELETNITRQVTIFDE